MPFLESGDLRAWAGRGGAADAFPSWIERVVRVGLLNDPERRFLKGAFNGLPGVDGWIRNAQVRDDLKNYLPEGDSIWEFSVQVAAQTKIRADAAKRMIGAPPASTRASKTTRKSSPKSQSVGPIGFKPETTTIVFVTPRGVADPAALTREIAAKANWKAVRVIDGQALSDWLELVPAVALAWAAEIHGVDTTRLRTFDMAWADIAGTTDPRLTKEIVIAGRDQSVSALIQQLQGSPRHIFVKGDSAFEAQAFILSAIHGDGLQRERSRTLVSLDYSAALQARGLAPSIIVVGSNNQTTTDSLTGTHRHHVVVAYGDPVRSSRDAIDLERPRRWDFAKGLESAGIARDEADRMARECGSSVTIMCRRYPSGQSATPWWALGNDASVLRPITLLGRWDAGNSEDRALIEEYSGKHWDDHQRELLEYINRDDAPLAREGLVWALGSHVDAFAILAPRLGDGDIKRFVRLVRKVFAPQQLRDIDNDPDSVFQIPKGPSDWLKNGIAQTLLLLAVRAQHFATDLTCPVPLPGKTDGWHRGTPNALVNALVAELPALHAFPQLYESIKKQYSVLMEAAPDPLLEALEHWLEGSPNEVVSMLSAKRGLLSEWPDVTELLWGLEVLAWSPDYLFRISGILAALARLSERSEQRESNRSLESLSRILTWWSPQTFAPLSERVAAVDKILSDFPDVGWALLLKLAPNGSMIQWPTATPQVRDMAPDKQEVLTRRIAFDGLVATIQQIFTASDRDPFRWATIIGMMSHFPPAQRDEVRRRLSDFAASEAMDRGQTVLWEALRDEIARHRTFAKAEWALPADELKSWELILFELAPADPVIQVKWLFDDWMPDLDEEMEIDSLQQRIDQRRIDAIRLVLNNAGHNGVLRLATAVKFPGLIGSSLAAVLKSEAEIFSIAQMALSRPEIDIQFVSMLMWSISKERLQQNQDPKDLLSRLAVWATSVGIDSNRIASMLTWLPPSQETWNLLATLGRDVESSFWKLMSPPLNLPDASAAAFITVRMLSAGRAAPLADIVAFGKFAISADDALKLLDAVITDLSARGEPDRALPRRLSEYLAYLGGRKDINDFDLAQREMVLVPALGYHHGLDLRLFKVLKEDPSFFILLVSHIYKSSIGDDSPTDENTKNLATRAYQLLSSWHHELNPRERQRGNRSNTSLPFPGMTSEGKIDPTSLMAWVAEARRQAKESGRIAPADNQIGQLLAYSPLDTDDHAWPDQSVRDVIDQHYSKDLESGILTEQFNKRGVHGVVEGGTEELALSNQARDWAKVTKARWPKTAGVLLELSKLWERERDRAIEWERVRRLEQRL